MHQKKTMDRGRRTDVVGGSLAESSIDAIRLPRPFSDPDLGYKVADVSRMRETPYTRRQARRSRLSLLPVSMRTG